jgi:hypothetical protein
VVVFVKGRDIIVAEIIQQFPESDKPQ